MSNWILSSATSAEFRMSSFNFVLLTQLYKQNKSRRHFSSISCWLAVNENDCLRISVHILLMRGTCLSICLPSMFWHLKLIMPVISKDSGMMIINLRSRLTSIQLDYASTCHCSRLIQRGSSNRRRGSSWASRWKQCVFSMISIQFLFTSLKLMWLNSIARKLIHFQRQSGCGFCKGQMTDERRNEEPNKRNDFISWWLLQFEGCCDARGGFISVCVARSCGDRSQKLVLLLSIESTQCPSKSNDVMHS